MMLVIRSVLFLIFQAAIAFVFVTRGQYNAWDISAAWWPVAVILTNFVCLALLIQLYQQEGKQFWQIFHLERQFVSQDLLFLLGFLIIVIPIAFLPNIMSATWLFGDPQIALDLLVRPLPAWAVIITFAFFPFLQGAVEIPTYMMYARPRLEVQGLHPWIAIVLTSFFLSAQHIFAPFLPNIRFVTYRLVMFLPFAVVIALVIRWRPRLMLYIAAIHILMDMSVAVMFLMVMQKS